MNGKFIVFEGLDSSGKSLQAKLLHEAIEGSYLTREPGEDSLALNRELRKFATNPDNDLSRKTRTLLFLADRNNHIENYIRPKLYDGKTVISDRFYISSLAYESDLESNFDVNMELIRTVYPDVTIFIDIDYKTVVVRRQKSDKREIYDNISEKEFELKRKAYKDALFLEWDKKRTQKLIIIWDDGKMTPEQIHDRIMRELQKKYFLKSVY